MGLLVLLMGLVWRARYWCVGVYIVGRVKCVQWCVKEVVGAMLPTHNQKPDITLGLSE